MPGAGPSGPERAAIGRGRAGAWPRAAASGWGRRRRESRLLSVHLRADARVFEAAPAAVPVAMSRFKVSKFRHTEARPSRREVSPARGSPRPRPSPSPGPHAGTPRARLPRGAPFRPGPRVPAVPSHPEDRIWRSLAGSLSGRPMSAAVRGLARLAPGPPKLCSPPGRAEA